MAKEAKKRFASCEEFAGALLQLDTAQLATPSPPAAPVGKGLAFRLPGRKAAEAPEPLEDQHTQARTTCTERDCTHHTEWMCSYQDRTGYGCGTWWCGKHIARVGNDAYCRRHASVIRALAVNAGTIREIKHLPDVNDRSLALAALVGGDIDKDITEILRRRYSSRKDVTVLADRAVRESRSGASVAWERNWSAARNQGYETRITLLVTAEEPAVVKLRVGSMEIFSRVPDWIGRRLAGKPANHSDRAHFRARLIETVSDAVDRPAPLAGGFHPAARADVGTPAPQALPDIDPRLLEGLVMRAFAVSPASIAAHEIAKMLALPFASIEPLIAKLTLDRFLEAGGIAGWDPLPGPGPGDPCRIQPDDHRSHPPWPRPGHGAPGARRPRACPRRRGRDPGGRQLPWLGLRLRVTGQWQDIARPPHPASAPGSDPGAPCHRPRRGRGDGRLRSRRP
jgi:hypothetical protein